MSRREYATRSAAMTWLTCGELRRLVTVEKQLKCKKCSNEKMGIDLAFHMGGADFNEEIAVSLRRFIACTGMVKD